MDALATMPKYEEYRNSGIDWLGDIPTHWVDRPLKYIMTLVSEKISSAKSELLYIGMENVESWSGKIKEHAVDVEGLASKFSKNDILFGKLRPYLAKVAIVHNEGLCSTEFLVYRVRTYSPHYFKYLLGSKYFIDLVDSSTYGSKMPRASSDFIGNQRLPLPSVQEQSVIVDFLNNKTAQIDEAIAIKEKQIALLKERKQIIIQKAVTQGLDPDVQMKDSGVDWIGQIPEHWVVNRAKYLFNEIDERSKTGDEELLSVSHMTGITPRSEKNVYMFMAEDYTGSKLCRENDLVFNIMWAWMGALGVSDRVGIVSPSYGVFRQQHESTFNSVYLEYLLKATKYIEYYNKVSTGLHSSRLRFYGHMFFAMKIGYPGIDEQNAIVEYLTEQTARIDRAIRTQEQQIEKLKEYKTTLINSAVTGKIKVA